MAKPPTAVPAARAVQALHRAPIVLALVALGLACASAGCDAGDGAQPDEGPAAGSGQPPDRQEQPPDHSGGQSGDPGSGPSECSGERWAGAQEPWIRARCTPIGDTRFSCECGEQDPAAVDKGANEATDTRVIGSASFASACRAALRDQCEIDPDAPVFCGLAEVGTCWPDDAGGWSCQCGAGVQHRPMTGSACDRALWAQCGERCETAFGTCGEVERAQYRCLCTGVDGPTPPDPEPPHMLPDGSISAGGVARGGPASCAEAMATYCGERCASSAGSCEPAQAGFACSCGAGGSSTQSFSELGGITPQACGMALQRSCGQELLAPMTTCTLPGAMCEASPRVWAPGAARPESYEYRCQCGAGAAPITLEASACYRAMLQACPDVLAGARPAPAAQGQLGALCDEASDCASGLCHRGRLQRDGVCSAPCERDDDCPDRALCSFAEGAEVGHCFVTCSGNDGYFACEALNDAFDDPLNCLDRVDLDDRGLANESGESGQICAPLSDMYWPLPVRR